MTTETPKHKPKPRRAEIVKLRLRPDEADAWRDEASELGTTLSNLIRSRMGVAQRSRNKPLRKRGPVAKADPQLIAALARVGNNLNQIARWANTHKGMADANQVNQHLIAIERILLSYRPHGAELQDDAEGIEEEGHAD